MAKPDNSRTTNSAPDTVTSGDGEYTVESGSVGFTAPPADTTVEAQAATPPTEEEAVAAEDAPPVVEGEESVGVSAQPAKVATPAEKPAPKKRTLAGRKDVLQGDVDRLTATRAQVKRDLDALNADLAARRREAETGAPKPAEKPAAKAAAPDAIPDMPEIPNYRDYDTDDDYETAKAQYRKDIAAWQTARETALETRVTSKVDSRLNEVQDAESHEAQVKAFGSRVQAVKGEVDPAEWEEAAENIRELRSSWYDPEKHNEIETPFLSDLSFANEGDGAKIGYFVGTQDEETRQALADLLPSKALRDALVHAPSVTPLLAHFVTPEGQREWEALKRMPPAKVAMTIGVLHSRLVTAEDRSPAPVARHTTTNATAPAKLPVARAGAKTATALKPGQKKPLEDWMADEDAAELAAKRVAAGLSA